MAVMSGAKPGVIAREAVHLLLGSSTYEAADRSNLHSVYLPWRLPRLRTFAYGEFLRLAMTVRRARSQAGDVCVFVVRFRLRLRLRLRSTFALAFGRWRLRLGVCLVLSPGLLPIPAPTSPPILQAQQG